jgi:hypothetical protein
VPSTPVYGLPYEKAAEAPGRTLRAPGPILAEAVETQLQRVDDDLATVGADVAQLQAVVQPTTGWTVFTPSITGHGSATFSTLTGRWRSLGFLVAHVVYYFVVDTAGSGTDVVQLGLPSGAPVNLATRQMIPCSAEGMAGGGGGNRSGHMVSFTSGDGLTWDRIRLPDGVDSHLDNLLGADLAAGMIFVAQGTYQVEESPSP